MNAGQLRHRVSVDVAVETQDESGDPVVAWTELGTLWGSVQPIRGREATYAGDQTLGEMDTRIRLRYSPLSAAITQAHRLRHQGTIFNVVSAAHVDLAQREVEILCLSGINDG
jgi:SPP1 family predicted phage head-tail adaptor